MTTDRWGDLTAEEWARRVMMNLRAGPSSTLPERLRRAIARWRADGEPDPEFSNRVAELLEERLREMRPVRPVER